LGPDALRFADWLADARQSVWQVLSLGPVGYGESPYQLFSAFAGNPLLISVETLVERGWLEPADSAPPDFSRGAVEFERVAPWKEGLLRKAFHHFSRRTVASDKEEFAAFARVNARWLDPYVEFSALKQAHGGAAWIYWERGSIPSPEELDFRRFVQWEFFRQWAALKTYCADRGIALMGYLPIYVAHDSADVWARQDLFHLDESGRPTVVAGVPPDYFSATGQLWGNPIYRWDRMAASGYRWWIARLRAALELFDLLRMDHFRGFEAYWEVPASEATAEKGQWVKGPGSDFFRALQKELGPLPVVAENLGVITPEVEAIRNEFGFPGMAVLQFAFGKDQQAHDFKPHNYVRNLAAYSGTHDNDTVMGWWRSEGGDSTRTPEDVRIEKARARAYLHTDGREMNWALIRTLMASVADLVLFPAQDVLGLGSEARMNTPATASGNWRWRMLPGALTARHAARLREMSEAYERNTETPSPAAS
jgi:4-alpha-glucanotransferase